MQAALGRRGRERDQVQLGQALAVARGDLVAAPDELVEAAELRQAQRAVHVAEPVVEAEVVLLVVPGTLVRAPQPVALETMGTKAPEAGGQIARSGW